MLIHRRLFIDIRTSDYTPVITQQPQSLHSFLWGGKAGVRPTACGNIDDADRNNTQKMGV